MTILTLRERLERASVAQAVDSRFKYAEKKCIGSGGMGVVYEERMRDGRGMVVQKVNLITQEHIHHYPQKGIVPLENVMYEDDVAWGTIIFKRKGSSHVDVHSLMHPDFYALKHAVYEYQNLRAVKGAEYFQQVVEDVLYTTDKGVAVTADREFFLLDGQLCVRTIMTKVPGYSLDYLCSDKSSREEKLKPQDIVKIGYDIAKALKYLGQEKHIVHRDVKLGNIVYNHFYESEKGDKSNNGEDGVAGSGSSSGVSGKGQSYLIDFGNSMRVAKGLTDVSLLHDIVLLLKKDNGSMFSGTPGYMSPEIILRNAVTEQSDIWSLGCSLFLLMTGKMPFLSDALGAKFTFGQREGLRDTLKDCSTYNSDLIEGICRMFAREPKDRSLDYFVEEAEKVLDGRKNVLRSTSVSMSLGLDDNFDVFSDTLKQKMFHDRTTVQI